jgi:hypothetical protein
MVVGSLSSAAKSVWPPRRLPLVIVALLLGSSLAACGEKQLPVVNVVGYTVNMPGKPRHTVMHDDTPAGPAPRETYISLVGRIGYSISVQIFPFDVDLDTAVDGLARNSEIVSRVKTTYKGFPARDVRSAAYLQGRRVVLFERVILAHRTLIDLLYGPVSPDMRVPPAAGRAFLGSLNIP